MALSRGKLNTPYVIHQIDTAQEDLRDFLFTLGCYPGEKITILSKLSGTYIVSIRDARYSIDESLAGAIFV